MQKDSLADNKVIDSGLETTMNISSMVQGNMAETGKATTEMSHKLQVCACGWKKTKKHGD